MGIPFPSMLYISKFYLNSSSKIDGVTDVDSTLIVSSPNRYSSELEKLSSIAVRSFLRCDYFVVIVEEEDRDCSSAEVFSLSDSSIHR